MQRGGACSERQGKLRIHYRERHHTTFEEKQVYPEGKATGTINVRALEDVLSHHPFVREAECYLTSGGKVGIEIYQRIPLLHVFSSNGDNYYVDDEGKIMASPGQSIHVPIATGFIDRKYAQTELYSLGKFLQTDPFWNAQVEQINVTPKQELEIVPRVGDHILFLEKAVIIKKNSVNCKPFIKRR